MAEKKEKRSLSDNVALMTEWSWDRNIAVIPSKLTLESNIKVWWKCNNGHEWQATVSHRHNGRGCPYCSGRKKQ